MAANPAQVASILEKEGLRLVTTPHVVGELGRRRTSRGAHALADRFNTGVGPIEYRVYRTGLFRFRVIGHQCLLIETARRPEPPRTLRFQDLGPA